MVMCELCGKKVSVVDMKKHREELHQAEIEAEMQEIEAFEQSWQGGQMAPGEAI